MTTYPNREHKNADEAAKRRALRALEDIEYETGEIRRGIHHGNADEDSTQAIADKVRKLTGHLGVLRALREVREWHAMDVAGVASAPQQDDFALIEAHLHRHCNLGLNGNGTDELAAHLREQHAIRFTTDIPREDPDRLVAAHREQHPDTLKQPHCIPFSKEA